MKLLCKLTKSQLNREKEGKTSNMIGKRKKRKKKLLHKERRTDHTEH
jgi:hypothetical protein